MHSTSVLGWGRGLFRATLIGTALQLAMVVLGHIEPKIAALFAMLGMFLSLVAGFLFGLWSGGLGNLIEKYQPSLIIYNYAQYYPWTIQLATMKSWRSIYLDGYIAIFAKDGYALQGSRYTVHGTRYTVQGGFPMWLHGFWKGPDYEAQDEIKVAKFWDQMNRAKLISENPDAIQAFNEGNQKYSSGDISGAMASYTKAIELNPSYYKAYNNLGILKASALKNFPDAIADFTKAIEIDPGLPDAWLSRGTCWLGLKQLDKACPDWRKAMSLGNQQATKMLERYCR